MKPDPICTDEFLDCDCHLSYISSTAHIAIGEQVKVPNNPQVLLVLTKVRSSPDGVDVSLSHLSIAIVSIM